MTGQERKDVEQTVLNAVGVSRSQARDALSQFAAQREQVQLQLQVARAPVPEPIRQSITTTSTALDKRPIANQDGGAGTTAPTRAATSGTPVDVSVISYGVAETMQVLTP